MSDVYYIIGGVAYGIFILQFIISWVAGELCEVTIFYSLRRRTALVMIQQGLL